ncbi:damage-inducible protein DinI [Mangrovibacter sp. MFB070]|uniref:DinI-like family protein n=1 Tax=Mangrovibacter sp. MFB070 TaxID=1224318 RepID=UPI0004D6B808|nr:DinI-like family protein [Mangrovibacter sp. MFB070]KEA51567.1 damage-inducible protein DinI [Mangrovibacter sp. MFB070]
MRVEISIAREKAKAMPKGSIDALKTEMTKRLSARYEDVEVIVKAASNDGLSVLRSADKEGDKEYVQEVLQETWESADDWFTR